MKKVNREAFEDPLSGLTTSSGPLSPTDLPAPVLKPAAVPVVTSSSDTGSLKQLDFDKVKLKTAKKEIAPASVSEEKVEIISPEKDNRLGLGVDLFQGTNVAMKSSTPISDDVLNPSIISISEDSGLFSPAGSKKTSVIDSNKESPRVPLAVKAGAGLRERSQEGDDSTYDDLKVSKLMEREENLDYDLFGKSRAAQIRSSPPKTSEPILRATNEDLDVGLSAAMLNDLETATEDKKEKATVNIFSFDSDIPSTSESVAIDLNNLDLDAYIAQQGNSSSGGLFG